MRVAEKPLHCYPWYVRVLLWLQRRKYGQVLKPALLWARSPRLFAAMAAFYGALERKRSPLEPALRSLVMVLVSERNGCRFCVDLNSALLAERSGSLDKLRALADWRSSPLLTERERAALEYAEAMTADGVPVSNELFARLQRHFDDDALVELTALIAFQNLSSRFNSALDVPAQGFCELPEPRAPVIEFPAHRGDAGKRV
jgi:uncharacterized peroxidase-related enzyme